MISEQARKELQNRVSLASVRYGPFASTHEALGVALAEWDELRDAVHRNSWQDIRDEALDLAAVLVRLWAQLGEDGAMRDRSGK